MTVLVLTKADIRKLVSMEDAIELMKVAFRELSAGRAASPLRTSIAGNAKDSVMLVMPASVAAANALGFKVVSIFPDNPARGLPTLNALVTVIDPDTGVPLAIMNGAYLTALRTGAISGAATDLLAKPDSKHLVIFGAGKQAVTQAAAVAAVRPIERISVVGRSAASMKQFEADVHEDWPELADALDLNASPEVMRTADVVCLATTSSTPVFDADLVAPGTHINGVGSFKPTMQEIPAATVAAATVVVDSFDAALEEAGDLIIPLQDGTISRDHIRFELGEIAARTESIRASDQEITFFKSVDNAVQDMVVASKAVSAAVTLGMGQQISLD